MWTKGGCPVMTHNHCMMTLFPHSIDVGLSLGLQQTDLLFVPTPNPSVFTDLGNTIGQFGCEIGCHHHAGEKKHLVGKHSLNTGKVSN